MVTRFYQELLSFLSRKVPDRTIAADLVQESYARLYASEQTGLVARDPRALLYRTARNLLIDQGRRGDVRARFIEPVSDIAAEEQEGAFGPVALEPDSALASQQMVHAVLATIDRLPARCRQAFILHKFDGLSHAEVAAHMGVSVKMIEQHVRNAMQACKRCRDEIDNDPSPMLPLRRRGRQLE